MDKAGVAHYKKTEEALLRVATGEADKPQNQAANLGQIADRLTRMGATRMYGRKH